MTRVRRCSPILALILALPPAAPAIGQEPADARELRRQIEELRSEQEALRREVEELKRRLDRGGQDGGRAAPGVAGALLDLGDNPTRGEASAALTLVEFTDYQCTYCARHFRQTYPDLVREYVESGKLRYVALDLPLERIHPYAFKAAEASHCAEEQGKYWEMHDRLFEHQQSIADWGGHAAALELDVEAFQTCLESGRFADSVRSDMAQAARAGAGGTPTFVLARTHPDEPGKVIGIESIAGAKPYGVFKAAIERALSAESP